MAHYRLGFLAYKQQNYKRASLHFDTALVSTGDFGKYNLNSQQRFQTNMYLVNAFLLQAEAARKQMIKIADEEAMDYEPLAAYKMSQLYDLVANNDAYLQAHAFVKHTPDGKTACSKDHCEKTFDSFDNDLTLILYISDHECKVKFSDESDTIPISQAKDLKTFLLGSSVDRPVEASAFDSPTGIPGDEMKEDTYSQRVRRLNRKLSQIEVPKLIDSAERNNGQRRRYYYNGQVPYIIMERVAEDNA